MLISVVVPIYNTEKYLPNCIDSILKQSYKEFELILVNDGSTDNSLKTCEYYKKTDARVKILDKNHQGLARARYSGAKIAKGEYIVNVDSDDYIDEDFLEVVGAILSKHEYDSVAFGLKYVSDTGVVIRKKGNTIKAGAYSNNDLTTIRKAYLYDNKTKTLNDGLLLYSVCCKAVRKSIFLNSVKAVPSKITNGEDTIFTAKLLEISDNMYIANYYGYNYRSNPSSQTKTRESKDLNNLIAVVNELNKIEFIDSIKLSGYYYNCLWNIISGLAKKAKSYNSFKAFICDFDIKKHSRDKQYEQLKLRPKDKGKIILLRLGNPLLLFVFQKVLLNRK